MAKKKLFITDFDGTLLNNDKTISLKDLNSLEHLQKNHIYTAIATGRSSYSFFKALKSLGLNAPGKFPVDYLIFSTGAGMYDFNSGEIIYKKGIPGSSISNVTTYFDEQKFDYMVLEGIPRSRYFYYRSTGQDNPDFLSRLALYETYAQPLKENHVFDKSATEVLAILPNGITSDRLDQIRTDLSKFSVVHATSPLDHKSAWIEVFHKDVSKSSTAAVLADMLKIDKKYTTCVGNDYNDLDILDWSQNSYVVENAPQLLKNMFEIVPSNNRSGVSIAIEKSGLLSV